MDRDRVRIGGWDGLKGRFLGRIGVTDRGVNPHTLMRDSTQGAWSFVAAWLRLGLGIGCGQGLE